MSGHWRWSSARPRRGGDRAELGAPGGSGRAGRRGPPGGRGRAGGGGGRAGGSGRAGGGGGRARRRSRPRGSRDRCGRARLGTPGVAVGAGCARGRAVGGRTGGSRRVRRVRRSRRGPRTAARAGVGTRRGRSSRDGGWPVGPARLGAIQIGRCGHHGLRIAPRTFGRIAGALGFEASRGRFDRRSGTATTPSKPGAPAASGARSASSSWNRSPPGPPRVGSIEARRRAAAASCPCRGARRRRRRPAVSRATRLPRNPSTTWSRNAADVAAAVLEPVEQLDAGQRVAADQRIDEGLDRLAVGDAKQLANVLGRQGPRAPTTAAGPASIRRPASRRRPGAPRGRSPRARRRDLRGRGPGAACPRSARP